MGLKRFIKKVRRTIKKIIPKEIMMKNSEASIKKGETIGTIIGILVGVFISYYLIINN